MNNTALELTRLFYIINNNEDGITKDELLKTYLYFVGLLTEDERGEEDGGR